MKHSLLPLNQSLLKLDQWNEAAIQNCGVELIDRAVKIWPK